MKQLLIFSLVLTASVTVYAQTTASGELPVKDFRTMIDTLHNVVILDLRTTDELKGGMIAGASQLDYFAKDFENSIAKLDPSKSYLIYCASGVRSEETRELMITKGFHQVYDLRGGFNQWRKEKMPIVPYKRP
jgi:rhodanese-related sulfurtransferase